MGFKSYFKKKIIDNILTHGPNTYVWSKVKGGGGRVNELLEFVGYFYS